MKLTEQPHRHAQAARHRQDRVHRSLHRQGKAQLRDQGRRDRKEAFADVAPAETKVLHVELKPGTYEILCPMEGHAGKGMKQTLTVK